MAESPSQRGYRARHQRYGLAAPVRYDEEAMQPVPLLVRRADHRGRGDLALPGLCSPYAACRAGRLESRFTGRCEAPDYGILIGQTCMLPAGGLCL